MSDKRTKFIELAEARVNRAIKDIRLIGNLSNKRAYDFSDADVKQIFRALQKEIDANKARFGDKGSGADSSFKLGR